LNGELLPDFYLPTEIYIQPQITEKIDEILKKFGKRITIVTTSYDFKEYYESLEQLSSTLKNKGLGCIIYDQLPQFPNTETIDDAVAYIKKTNSDLIIGFGGINSINAGKAISLLMNNYIFCHDIFSGELLKNKPINFVSMPTIPTFGFEIAPLFFLNTIEDNKKVVYFDKKIYPAATIIDPSLSLIADIDTILKGTIASLAISTESIISKINNDIINTYALKSIDFIFRNAFATYNNENKQTPITYLLTASLMAGVAFSTSFLSVTLAISLAIASFTEIEIEDAMVVILPHIMEFNLTSSPGKYVQMSKVMGEEVRDITVIEAAIKAIEAIRKLETDINLPQRLSQFNIDKSLFKEISNFTLSYQFTRNTPRELTASEIETILIAAY